MARKALLIGAQTEGLAGVDNDVKAMANALQEWGFAPTLCEAENATRAGILEAYKRLIDDAQADDAMVIFYSGHGGRARQPGYEGAPRPLEDLRFIAPTDFQQSREGDFRGILSLELSHLQRQLTAKTPNVTVILDCCHSGNMSRGTDLVAKNIVRSVSYSMITAHFESLKRRGMAAAEWRQFGNSEAVRVVACAPDERAFETDDENGERHGLLTEALLRALREAKAGKVSWFMVMDWVRKRVITKMPSQRPDVEGPAHRLLFDLIEADPVAAFPVTDDGAGRARLEGGRLLGIQVGDELVVMPEGSTALADGEKIGDIHIDRLGAMAAYGTLALRTEKLPLGSYAWRVKAAAEPLLVRLPTIEPAAVLLKQAIADTGLLLAADLKGQTPYEVKVSPEGGYLVCDDDGPLHVQPRPADRAGVAKVRADLHRLAQAKALRGFTVDPRYLLKADVTVDFGLADGGAQRGLNSSGDVLYLDQHIYIKVRNKSQVPLYVNVLEIGVAGQISLLNQQAPAGVRLEDAKEHVFGWNEITGEFTGLPLHWPDELPGDEPRLETILVLVTSQAQDLRVFEQEGVRAVRSPQSALEQIFDQIGTGRKRDVAGLLGSEVHYALHTIDFDLMPARQPVREKAAFQVDERPQPSVRLYSPKGAAAKTVAVRLADLTVSRNRTLRNADIRLDAMVLTSARDVQTSTRHFPGIRDGEPLPTGGLLIYQGPAVDYLDIAIWVTRDRKGSLDLSDLLRSRPTSVAAPPPALPRTAMAVAAIDTDTMLINTAHEVLSERVGDCIGIYRTTLMAHESFGTERHPEQNTVRAQDFSFTYAVEDLSDR